MTQPIEHVFIIHVSEGYEDRRAHIDKHLPESGIKSYEYVLKGDIKDLSPEVLNSIFKGSLRTAAEHSCFYKHYLACKKIVDKNLKHALIFEDDVLLNRGFSESLDLILKELESESNYLVNIEDAYLSVPYRFRKRNQKIYLANYTKMCGAYIIDKEAATRLVTFIEKNGTTLPIDTYQSEHRDAIRFNLYWSEPSLVHQGSKSGLFESSVNEEKQGLIQLVKYKLKCLHKKFVWSHVNNRVIRVFKNVNKY
ncbi:glycosyltransferase family 25 protein [Vibrio genomosp. F10]|uniref:glycosyltransferase family 25 protein n=1 Tax=Vibrio genomosp. F10 TaxID=723171 RepID=UPI0002E8EB38|nr:glycosyltransferase family 25 protein [Vibrio genomosp. F10]OEF01329.1 3-deoxy-D-manno-octulosonic acid transferase [Vibrio genomosp. F10 str. 9ZD137]